LEQASNDKLPSWLRTPEVKLRPLHELEEEQQLDQKLAQGKVDAKLAKEAHPKAVPTPREMAMRSVHRLATKKQNAVRVLRPMHVQLATDPHGHSGVHEQAKPAEAQPQASSALSSDGKQKAKAAAPAPVDLKKIAAEIKSDQEKLKAVEKGQESADDAVRKDELHKLASIKAIADKTRTFLDKDIKQLQGQEIHSEKAHLKAEMAKIEEQEEAKLAAIKKKMAGLPSQFATKLSTTTKAAPASGAEKSHEKQAHSAAATTAAASASKPAQEAKATATSTATAKDQQKSAKKGGDSDTACNEHNCDVRQEDAKWLADKHSVDKFAKLAYESTHLTGKARQQALAHMKALEESIKSDFQHVTSFAHAQEKALPPPPKE
jgi:hypothetical protein